MKTRLFVPYYFNNEGEVRLSRKAYKKKDRAILALIAGTVTFWGQDIGAPRPKNLAQVRKAMTEMGWDCGLQSVFVE